MHRVVLGDCTRENSKRYACVVVGDCIRDLHLSRNIMKQQSTKCFHFHRFLISLVSPDPCRLACRLGWTVKVYGQVADGTRCYGNPSKYDICIQGKCRVRKTNRTSILLRMQPVEVPPLLVLLIVTLSPLPVIISWSPEHCVTVAEFVAETATAACWWSPRTPRTTRPTVSPS